MDDWTNEWRKESMNECKHALLNQRITQWRNIIKHQLFWYHLIFYQKSPDMIAINNSVTSETKAVNMTSDLCIETSQRISSLKISLTLQRIPIV